MIKLLILCYQFVVINKLLNDVAVEYDYYYYDYYYNYDDSGNIVYVVVWVKVEPLDPIRQLSRCKYLMTCC